MSTHNTFSWGNKKSMLFGCQKSALSGAMDLLYLSQQCWPSARQNLQSGTVPSEDSDQLGHPPSLIRVFAVCMKKAWVLSNLLSTQQRLIRLGRCPGWSESLLGAHAILLVLSCTGSFVYQFIIVEVLQKETTQRIITHQTDRYCFHRSLVGCQYRIHHRRWHKGEKIGCFVCFYG